jgi:hypothetical protein
LSWSTPFYEAIILPDGRKLVTLKDAATYITNLPKKESALPEWQTAIEVLMLQPWRRHHDGADRRTEGAESERGAGVQSRPQRHALGQVEAEAGRIKDTPG